MQGWQGGNRRCDVDGSLEMPADDATDQGICGQRSAKNATERRACLPLPVTRFRLSWLRRRDDDAPDRRPGQCQHDISIPGMLAKDGRNLTTKVMSVAIGTSQPCPDGPG